MKIKPKKFVNFVERQPHWLSNRQGYFTMERNERVDEFPKTFMKELKNAIHSFDLRTYPDTHLIYEEVAKWLKVKNDQIIIHEGADGGLLRVFDVFISGGDRVITCSPSFAMYPVYCQMFGAKHYPLELKVKNYDYYKELQKKIKKIKPKLVAIANPNQPIEAMLSLKQIKNICKLAEKLGSLVIIDEAYYHFGSKSEIKNAAKNKNLIVMRTFSKAWGLPSIRLGFLVANRKLCKYVSKCRSLVETNALSYQIAMWALSNKKILNNHVLQIKKGSNYIQNNLKKLNLFFKGGNVTNAILIKLKNKKETEKLRLFMRKRKIYIRTNFKDSIEDCIRISLGPVKKMKKFMKVFNYWLKIKK